MGRKADATRETTRPMTLKEQMQTVMLQLYRNGIHLNEAEREFKKLFIIMVLEDCNFNQCKAAIVLQMHRNTLNRLLHILGIKINDLKRGRKPPRAIVVRAAVKVNAG